MPDYGHITLRYITKGGEILHNRIEFTSERDRDRFNLPSYVGKTIMHANGLFPYRGGYISSDALLRIEIEDGDER